MSKREDGYATINKYIDTKPMFGNWEVDSFAILILFIGMGAFISPNILPILAFTGIGFIAAKFYEKAKKAKMKGFFFHILYMLGIRMPKTLPPSHMRYFLGA